MMLLYMMKVDREYQYSDELSGSLLEYDSQHSQRPSWVRYSGEERTQYLRLKHEGSHVWYRRYFEDYFFIFEPSAEDYKNYYDAIAQAYDSMVPQNKEIAEFIRKKLQENLKEDARVLELSAGTGIISEAIAEFDLTITDISKDSLKIAKHRTGLSDDRVIAADLNVFEPDGMYDAVVESMGLDYFTDEQLKNIVERLLPHLAKGAMLIIVDRHRYPVFEHYFTPVDSGSFDLKTPTGTFPYQFFVGKLK